MPASVASSTATTCHPPCCRARPNKPDRYAECRQSRSRRWSSRSVREHLKLTDGDRRRSLINDPRRARRGPTGPVGHRTCQAQQAPVQARAKPATRSRSRGTRRHRRRRREILMPESVPSQDARPIRSETRALWSHRSHEGAVGSTSSSLTRRPMPKASRSARGCSVRKVNMTISLAFLAPDLVKAAIEGRLPAAWASPGSAICPPNGRASTRCSASPRHNRAHSNRSLPRQSPFPGNGISRPETNAAENACPTAIAVSQRPNALTKARQLRGYLPTFGKSPLARDCVVGPGGLEPPTRPL